MLVSDTGCCAQKMMKHSIKKQGASRIGRTLPKATDDSDMYNRAFPVGRKGSTSILPALHLLRHAIRSCCQRIKYVNCYHTQRKRKIRTLLQSEIGSDFSCLVGAGGFEQLAFTHTHTGKLKNHRRQATFHSTQDSLKQQCAQFYA